MPKFVKTPPKAPAAEAKAADPAPVSVPEVAAEASHVDGLDAGGGFLVVDDPRADELLALVEAAETVPPHITDPFAAGFIRGDAPVLAVELAGASSPEPRDDEPPPRDLVAEVLASPADAYAVFVAVRDGTVALALPWSGSNPISRSSPAGDVLCVVHAEGRDLYGARVGSQRIPRPLELSEAKAWADSILRARAVALL